MRFEKETENKIREAFRYALYLDLKEDNKCGETTRYYVCDKYTGYDEPEELIEEEFSDLVIGEYEESED